MTEDNLELLAASRAVIQFFGTSKRFLQLYRSQIKCTQFGSLPIPQQHCLDTYNLILDFINDTRKWNTSIFTIDIDTAPLLGALHHIFQTNEPNSIVEKSEQNSRFWHILKVHHKFDQDIISRYAEQQNDKRIEFEPNKLSKQDKTDIRSIKSFIQQEFRYPDQVSDFYILLFFDIYSAFLYYVANPLVETKDIKPIQVIKRMSHFVLLILPKIIGTYRFGEFNSELKDLAFYNIDMESYLLTETSIKRQLPSDEWISQIDSALKNIINEFPVRVSVLQRRKNVYSAFLKSLNYQTPVETLWDLVAFRIIIDSENIQYCYDFLSKIQEGFMQWSAPKGYADYIVSPKANGYQSLHLVLEDQTGKLAEVQIRTSRMNFIAEFGTASHEVYKSGKPDETGGQESTYSAMQGRMKLESLLKEHGLSINDFIEHLGISLEHIPIEHYYEGIAAGQYDLRAVIDKILQTKEGV